MKNLSFRHLFYGLLVSALFQQMPIVPVEAAPIAKKPSVTRSVKQSINPLFRALVDVPLPRTVVSIHGSLPLKRFKLRGRPKAPPFVETPVYWVREGDQPDADDLFFGMTDQADGNYEKWRAIADFPSLVNEISGYMDQNPDRDLIFFVHGCCINFDKAFDRASSIARSTGQPVMLYSWPSVPMKFSPTLSGIASDFGYNKNEAAYDATKSDFGRFFSSFEERLGKPDRMILMAHSMGNRFVDSELELRYLLHHNKDCFKKFKCAILACADVDANAFISHKKRIAGNSQQTWIIANDKDKALKQSLRVHQGFRVGNPHDKALSLLCDGIKLIETTDVQKDSHDLPVEILGALLNNEHYPDIEFRTQPDQRIKARYAKQDD